MLRVFLYFPLSAVFATKKSLRGKKNRLVENQLQG